jgi:hypothetical protein
MPALDFTAMMSAAAAQHLGELAAKDADIAELEAACAAKDAYIAKLEPANSAYIAQLKANLKEVFAFAERLAAANAELKTKVAALESLVSERAVAAEQQAFDDLHGSVIAEEAAEAAARAAQAEEAEPAIDLTGEDEAAPAPDSVAQGGAAASAKAKVFRGTLAWQAYVKHIKDTHPSECQGLSIAKLTAFASKFKCADLQAYLTFVDAWYEAHPGEGLKEMDEDQRKAAISAARKRDRVIAAEKRAARAAAVRGSGDGVESS